MLLLLVACASGEPARDAVDVEIAAPPSATAVASQPAQKNGSPKREPAVAPGEQGASARATAASPWVVPSALPPPTSTTPPSSSGGNAALAQTLFEEARKAMNAGDFKTACKKFEESHRAEPALGTLLNIARCHEVSGNAPAACKAFREAELTATKLGQSERAKLATESIKNLKCP